MKQLVLFLFLSLPFACSPQPSETPQATVNTARLENIRIAMRGGPDTFNPYMTTVRYGETVAARLFPTLMKEGAMEQGLPTLKPYLASQFEDDGLTTMVTLNKGLTWSDGTPITAKDVIYSYEIQTNEEVAWLNSDRKANIASMTLVDDYSLQVTFKSPSPFNHLDLNEGYIIPAHHFQKFQISEWKRDWSNDLVTFGPYSIETWDEGQRLVLKPRQEGMPRVGIAIARDQETLLKMLQTKQIDAAIDLPTQQIDQLKDGLKAYFYDDFGASFIGWNLVDPSAYEPKDLRDGAKMAALRKTHPHPVFGDVRVRQALAFAIDRKAMIEQFWKGNSRVPTSPWQSQPSYFKSSTSPRNLDLDRAKALLKEAGWLQDSDGLMKKDGTQMRFTIIAAGNNQLRSNYLLSIQQQLKTLGINVNIDLQESGRFAMNAQTRNFDAMHGSFNFGTSPDLKGLYHSASPMNFYNWDGVDQLLGAVPQATTKEELAKALITLDETFFNEQPMLMLYQRMTIVGSVEGINLKSSHVDPLHAIETWGDQP